MALTPYREEKGEKLRMNIKIAAAIGIVALTVVVGAGIVATLTPDEPAAQQTTTTTVTTSTTTTPTSKDTPTKETDKSSESTTIVETKRKGASYQTFSEKAFRAAPSGSSRVLFFYDQTHAPSVAIDAQIQSHIEAFPETLYIYRVAWSENKELAEQVGATTPGTALKYDKQSRMTHVYVAPDNPTFEGFTKSLDIEN